MLAEQGWDRRRIQTAVIGDEHSDDPVVLPLEAIEVDAFRRAHRGDTFWCGVLLGGCGKQLTTKLYLDRACHLAHFPEPGGAPTLCRRTATGVSSADHLYIKRGLTRWLAGSGIHIAAQVPPGGTGTIVLSEPATGADWWIHLPSAARAQDRPTAPTPPLRTLLTEDHPADVQLRGQGFVHRIRCEAAGIERRVKVGTQVGTGPGRTEWFDLSDCSLTRDGLITPALARLRSSGSAAEPRPQEQRSIEPEARDLVAALRTACRRGNADQAEELADRAFQLCLQREGATRTALRTAVVDARAWLRGLNPESRRAAAFTELKRLTREGPAHELSACLHRVMRLTPRTRTNSERDILHAARARVMENAAHLPESTASVPADGEPDTPEHPGNPGPGGAGGARPPRGRAAPPPPAPPPPPPRPAAPPPGGAGGAPAPPGGPAPRPPRGRRPASGAGAVRRRRTRGTFA
ncbi:hypothetical protein ACFVZ3_19275 [Kitasatospora purpeofusca]|uniref:hypothetical protein n=1 Tax=Kitasatospora purpeofusca TaxID=67352 RepID=UPI003674069F